ncbi:MAG: beta-propeller fold lactonase family protein [Jatrophihabitantaceae bacterium]
MTTTGGFLLVGGYTPPTGAGQGIQLVQHCDDGLVDRGMLAATESPSFLAISADGERVYAVNETAPGRVSAFARTGPVASPGLEPLGSQSTGGAHPCHLALHPSGRLLAVANYSSGSVAIHPLDGTGALQPYSKLLRLHGSGPSAERQDGPHAHQVSFAGGDELIVADLGSDRLWRFSYRAGASLRSRRCACLRVAAPGSCCWTRSPGTVTCSVSWTTRSAPWTGDNRSGCCPRLPATPSHWSPAPCRRGSFAGLGPACCTHRIAAPTGSRSCDRTMPVSRRWLTSRPTGRSPRHLALSGSWLYIANQLSNTLAGVPVSRDTGLRSGPVCSLALPSPSCVLPW